MMLFFTTALDDCFCKKINPHSPLDIADAEGGTKRGEWGTPLLPYFENLKKCPNFGEKALVVSIFGLNFPTKMQF